LAFRDFDTGVDALSRRRQYLPIVRDPLARYFVQAWSRGMTAGALALLGALLDTCGAYLALVAWHRSNLQPLIRVPFFNLVVILAGREPPTISHQPLD
jgi:hypothetical protein